MASVIIAHAIILCWHLIIFMWFIDIRRFSNLNFYLRSILIKVLLSRIYSIPIIGVTPGPWVWFAHECFQSLFALHLQVDFRKCKIKFVTNWHFQNYVEYLSTQLHATYMNFFSRQLPLPRFVVNAASVHSPLKHLSNWSFCFTLNNKCCSDRYQLLNAIDSLWRSNIGLKLARRSRHTRWVVSTLKIVHYLV